MGNTLYTFKSSGSITLNEIAASVDPHKRFWSSHTSNVQMNQWPVRKLAQKENTNQQLSLADCYGHHYYHIGYGW